MTKITAQKSPIKKFHISEKAGILNESNTYVFAVEKSATKAQIIKEVSKVYKVTPVKVNIVNVKPTRVAARGKVGKTNGLKKAYVFLKKGQTIDIA